MEKKTIRLTEAELHQIIAKSVKNIIKENSTDEGMWDTMKSFAGQYGRRGMDKAKQMGSAAGQKMKQGYNNVKQGAKNAANTVQQGYNNVKADVQQTAQNARQDSSMKDMQKAFNNFKMAVQKFTQNGGKINPQLNSRIKGIENMMNQYQSHF